MPARRNPGPSALCRDWLPAMASGSSRAAGAGWAYWVAVLLLPEALVQAGPRWLGAPARNIARFFSPVASKSFGILLSRSIQEQKKQPGRTLRLWDSDGFGAGGSCLLFKPGVSGCRLSQSRRSRTRRVDGAFVHKEGVAHQSHEEFRERWFPHPAPIVAKDGVRRTTSSRSRWRER
jgi:hypothetical protein